MKLSIFLCVFYASISSHFNFSLGQTVNQSIQQDAVPVKLVEKSNGLSFFSFEVSSNFNEFQTKQQVNRFEQITESSITLNYKNERLEIGFERAKFSDSQLNDLISGLTVVHGHKNYLIRKK